jgi:hypothetical protein
MSLKPLLGAMLGIVFVMAVAAPAMANGRDEWNRHMVIVRHYHHPRPHMVMMAPPAPVVYAPPAVVYAPPPQPAGINLIIPLNFR